MREAEAATEAWGPAYDQGSRACKINGKAKHPPRSVGWFLFSLGLELIYPPGTPLSFSTDASVDIVLSHTHTCQAPMHAFPSQLFCGTVVGTTHVHVVHLAHGVQHGLAE